MHRSWNKTSRMNTKLPPRLWLDASILLAPASKEAGAKKNVHLLCDSNGQSLVEFALVVPLLLLLLLGAIEIGRVAYYAIAVSNAARSAVQYGAQTPTTAGNIDNIVQAALDDARYLSPDNVTIDNKLFKCPDADISALSNTPPTDCGADGTRYLSYLKVNTQMQLAPLIGFPGIPASFSLKGEAFMRIGQ